MNLLPPKHLLEQWRQAGLSPEQIYQKCREMDKNRKRILGESRPKESEASRQKREAARAERERQRRRDTERVRSLREQNKTWEEISRTLGRSTWYLARLRQEGQIPNFRVKPKPYFHHSRKLPSDEELVRLFEKKSVREICDLYNVTRQAVHWRLDRAGIPRRKYKARGNKKNPNRGKRAGEGGLFFVRTT